MDNIILQKEEQEVLKSIYDEQWKKEIDGDNSYSIQINAEVKLYILLNSEYPAKSPPIYQLLAPTLTTQKKNEISLALDSIYLANLREPILFQWIEKLKELVHDTSQIKKDSDEYNFTNNNEICASGTNMSNERPLKCNIILAHGPIIVDRKSIFQGHVCKVISSEDVKTALRVLQEDKKISQATHNIYSYIIKQGKGTYLQDCNDDGEKHAGGRLLHLLQILKVENILVVVSRWFGGIHLGPDRFRHINNAARQALISSGYHTA